MDKEKLRQRLMTTFLGELEEHVRSLSRDLTALEKEPSEGRSELLAALFRTVHSLKGASRSVKVQAIETVSHRLESVLGAARDGVRELDPDTIQLLFSTADALKDAGERLRAQQPLAHTPLQGLLPRLDEAARRIDRPSTSGFGPASGAGPASPAVPITPVLAASVAPPVLSDTFMRVSVEKLDTLLARSGELLVARRRAAACQDDVVVLRDALQRVRSEWRQLEQPFRRLVHPNGASGAPHRPKRAVIAFARTRQDLKDLERRFDVLSSRVGAEQHVLDRVATALEEDIRRVRMLPFGEIGDALERTVRDLARTGGKEVDLVTNGSDVELDRAVLERLKDPLLHLVRNAVDHGVEPPDERRSSGKLPRATVTLAVALRGGGVEIVVTDDGRGLDMAAIREQALRKNLTPPEDDREAARLIFLPGFSTAPIITELSGRGVGLDVVRHGVESLHGRVDFSFEPGRSTRVALMVPLTLTTIRALTIAAGGHVFALPVTSVRHLVRAGSKDLGSAGGCEVLLSDGSPVPVVSLAALVGLQSGAVQPSGGKVAIVVIASADKEVALAVDELISEEEVVVKTLGARLRRVRHFTGATLLPTGRIALILNGAQLVETALSRAPSQALAPALDERRLAIKRRLLVVDDSVTTRSLEKSILEGAGYEVLAAADGRDGWQLLQEKGADLVVADVEMPNMDGFALCEAIRGSKRFRDLPVVLVTALESDRDKARGLAVGADAYLPKSTFDQRQLLETIAQLL